MGLVYDVGADDDFASLRDTPEFRRVLDRVAQSKSPVSHAAAAFTIPARDILPEDIAYDSKTRRFFISSVHKGIILTIDSAGDSREFARSEWPVLALGIDPGRRRQPSISRAAALAVASNCRYCCDLTCRDLGHQ